MGREGGIACAKKWVGTPEQRAWSSRGGKNQPFEAKSAAGKKRFALHGSPATYESRLKGSQALTTEQRRLGATNQPHEDKVFGGDKGRHARWHIARNRPNPKKCYLCFEEEQMARKSIVTLEHRSFGILKIVVAGTTDSGKPFIRVELPLGNTKKRFRAILVDDENWVSPLEDVLKVWENFNTERGN